MNTKIFLSLLLAFPLLLASCKKELEPQVSFVTPKAPSDNAAAATPPAQVQQNSAVTMASPNSNSGLNPAHGQPGHRCDIHVGEPLNSPPGNKAAQQPVAQIQQPVNSSIKVAPTTKTAPGMNPPHGQPGHRCDISVGAPLNSPASKITTQQTAVDAKQPTSITPATTTTVNTVPADGTPAILKAPTETAPGMNPPHGQPGHVCGTPVGSPLPK